jgi:hypothetical protein
MSQLLLLDADRAILAVRDDALLTAGVSFDVTRKGTPRTIALSDGDTLTDLIDVGPTVFLDVGDTWVYSLDPQP